jgi:hypothetical protein
MSQSTRICVTTFFWWIHSPIGILFNIFNSVKTDWEVLKPTGNLAQKNSLCLDNNTLWIVSFSTSLSAPWPVIFPHSSGTNHTNPIIQQTNKKKNRRCCQCVFLRISFLPQLFGNFCGWMPNVLWTWHCRMFG